MSDSPIESKISDEKINNEATMLTPPASPAFQFEEGHAVYQKDGFHPVNIGEVYNGKYKVLRKLGYGNYSTVWLVQNELDKKYWAMKVYSGGVYGAGSAIEEFELKVLKHLRDADPSHDGYEYISILHDSFKHQGPNGEHHCFIFKVKGESLQSFVSWWDRRPPIPIIRNFVNQLLYALDYTHSCGIVHTDIKPDNIMIQIPDDSIISEYLEKTSVKVLSQDPTTDYQIIQSTSLREFYFAEGFNLMKLKIALSDWTTSSFTSNHLIEFIQSDLLRAPEVFLAAPWDTSADIWNLGALVPELIYNQNMFSGRDPNRKYNEVRHLQEMENLFGLFPRSLLDKACPENVETGFGEDGKISLPETTTVGLEVRFGDMEESERAEFIEFVRAMLVIDPEKRKSAKELQEMKWAVHDFRDK
ncbi:Protein kinase-like (PK-like) [Glarea lozoyensis ATCC 20868]|uniref:non-specific serine/threonine protein kinase n=1 Tax=Glarea lozoyensis (strain ATCC 20868 / MF5171) TaxID=1116229 RepID=S3DCL9_GLAL2|nr:Protein kinase-like (PK-like) [Glarea lozoyensis ATCC 20868]EPE36162.1 Protein kinase-like (PK-like) [Glarea lozoyensis ATCC 20868]